MIFPYPVRKISSKRQKIVDTYTLDENTYIDYLLHKIKSDFSTEKSIEKLATNLVQQVRDRQSEQHGILAFIRLYNLSTEEGVVLMCLAEALLRIPDTATANKLIKDKLSSTNWEQHLGESNSLFVNASTWGLMLSGKLVQLKSNVTKNVNQYFYSLIGKTSEPVIRAALKEAMRILGQQFVISETIEDAIKHSEVELKSFDMLGEAAITDEMANSYFKSYLHAIKIISSKSTEKELILSNNISIKLSALHPRYEFSQQHKLKEELYPKLQQLINTAINYNVAITIDAEESNRLDIMLDAFEYMYEIAVTKNWPGLGLAVQAYQYRSRSVIKWLDELSCKFSCAMTVRLVKGAYWDTEIKLAQQLGFEYYPVFTRKENTDLNYLGNAQLLLACKFIYPQFATHNAHTIASIIFYSKTTTKNTTELPKFEFQRLFGMGELLYDSLLKEYNISCRVYAPVGTYKTLLSYLVRRLLENGANTSFVQRIENTEIAISTIIKSPIEQVKQNSNFSHPNITLPGKLYADGRNNASGINLTDTNQLDTINTNFVKCYQQHYIIQPIINGVSTLNSDATRQKSSIYNPANQSDFIGSVELANEDDVKSAMAFSKSAVQNWSELDIKVRTEYFLKLSNLIEENKIELISIIVREAGRCIPDAVSEIRETVDFCRYYARQALALFQTESLNGPTGE
ncbi:MAG: bifunctional proline dehydrogenase/L-glutamate gamma-semialdehyde dehydrogenase PutA, partial [Thiohalomonadales bacterium]